MQKFEIVPQQLFRAEAERIIPAFGPQLIALHHLGSINRVGRAVKPIIEIWVEVANIEKIANFDLLAKPRHDQVIDEFTRKLIQLGYTPQGEQGLTGRRFFTKDSDPAATYHLHTYQFGHFQPGYPQNATTWGTLMQWLTEPMSAELPLAQARLAQVEAPHLLNV